MNSREKGEREETSMIIMEVYIKRKRIDENHSHLRPPLPSPPLLLSPLHGIIRITKYRPRDFVRAENPTEPYMGLEPLSPCVCCEYSPRDLSILASSHISGQVNSWDTRTGNKPVQSSHPRYSHR